MKGCDDEDCLRDCDRDDLWPLRLRPGRSNGLGEDESSARSSEVWRTWPNKLVVGFMSLKVIAWL